MENKIRSLFQDQLEAKECFGGAAAVIKNREVIFNESFGDERFNENSIYRLASVTKIIVSAAILRLYEEGKLDIYDKVSKYFPSFARLSLGAVAPNGMIYSTLMPSREITLFDLLTHTAGLGSDDMGNREYTVMPPEEKVSLKRVTEYYGKNFHLAFEPGSRYAYSGFAGFDVLGAIAESVTGKSLDVLVKEYVCEPLSMTDTTFQPTDGQFARIVPMHHRVGGVDKEVDYKGRVFRGMERSYEAAGASLVSSVGDMIKLVNALMYGGLLKDETVDLMFAPALKEGLAGLARGENSGLGCFVISGEHRMRKGVVFSHGAYGTHIVIDRKNALAGIFMKNSLFNMSTNSPATVEFEKAVLG